uniref:Large ribosomal subunit protein uL18c n=1 Tax=Asparagopsis taxiformis TaxID=260499 RepID=A0A1C9CCH4_9FLOR|nr:ribosomal protein L18 [Asparagopsis taxiformis]AOM66067.1 ribosomal protein L18 [Asparagopsis taxiformis]
MIKKLKGTLERPRLYVFRSNKHIYAQIIDDINKKILASSSSLSNKIKMQIHCSSTCEASQIVGNDIGTQAINQGIKQVVFDRGKRLYHGRIKALAEAARQAGINF